MTRLGAFLHTSRKRVLAIAAALFVVAGVLGAGVAEQLGPYGADDPDTESVIANQRLEAATGLKTEPGLIAVVGNDKAAIAEVTRLIEQSPEVGATAQGPLSRDRDKTFVAATFKAVGDDEIQDAAEAIAARLDGVPGVSTGGFALANQQVNEQVSSDLARAEMLAFPLLFLLSFLFFRSLVAALLPLFVGALAIVATMFLLRLYNGVTDVSVFALNLTTGLGLGLAIDYSLFMVSRYREELAIHGPGVTALQRMMATAGKTVIFSSLTVAAALASLLVFPQKFLYSMGLGGASVALAAAAVSVIVLPALLAVLGPRVNALAPRRLQRAADRDARPTSDGGWYRLSRFVMRRPLRIAMVAGIVLIIAGLPFSRIEFTSVDASVLPADASARQVQQVLDEEFPPHRDSPVTLAIAAPADSDAARQIAAQAQGVPGVQEVLPARPAGERLSSIDVILDGRPVSDSSLQAVRDLRALETPVEALATGQTADDLDLRASLVDHLPIAVAIVALATLVVLFLMTGSIVLPIKALVMNVLTLSATFGALVLIFQDGRFTELLSYEARGAVEITMPVLLFAVAFGLSTDYGVFLLSRIKEARDRGVPDSEAVAVGLERTGRIVTAAALLFAIAIGAFATSEIVFIKENGVGTALAVLIDATIVRAFLVPSLMELLGRWNWWAPGPLRRLHARIGLDEGGDGPTPSSAEVAPA